MAEGVEDAAVAGDVEFRSDFSAAERGLAEGTGTGDAEGAGEAAGGAAGTAMAAELSAEIPSVAVGTARNVAALELATLP